MNHPNIILNNTTVADNITVNNLSNTTSTSINNSTPTTSSTINVSPQEAIQIVDNTMSPYDKATGDAVLENETPDPIYVVNIIHTNGVANGTYGGYVTVDAVTGFCNHKGV